MEPKYVTLDEVVEAFIKRPHMSTEEIFKIYDQTGYLYATGGMADFLSHPPANADAPVITEDIECEIVELKKLPWT